MGFVRRRRIPRRKRGACTMRLRTDRTRKVIRRRPIDQSINDDLLLHPIVGPCNLSQEHESRLPISRSVAKNHRKKAHKLTGGVVPVRFVLGKRQAQQQVSAFIKTVGMEGNFLQSPDEMATNVAPNRIQVRNVPKRSPNPFGHQGSINLGQRGKNLCVGWLGDAFDTVERPASHLSHPGCIKNADRSAGTGDGTIFAVRRA